MKWQDVFSATAYGLVVSVVVLFGGLRYRERNDEVGLWRERALSLGHFVAEAAQPGIVFNDRDTIERSWAGVKADPTLLYVRIADAKLATLSERGSAPPFRGADQETTRIEGTAMTVELPIFSNRHERIGSVELGFSLATLLARRRIVDTLTAMLLVLLCVGLVGIDRVLRERHRMQDQLIHADRLASLGRLTASVAHEINNPLAFVTANLGFASKWLARVDRSDEESKDVREALGEAIEGAERIRRIVADMKSFSRSSTTNTATANLRDAVETATKIAGNEIRQRGRILRGEISTTPVQGDQGRLVQVIVNLLVNAAQALPADGGEIRVRSVDANGEVALEVEDTGSGMSPDVRRHLFEPFFTTKPQGEGTGLGLYLCHSIIASFGGRIDVQSAPGQGSTFRLVLPHTSGGAPLESAATTPVTRAMRLLIVDDDPLVLRALERMASGHQVVAVKSPTEALLRLDGDEPFDAVICDVMMPGMTGPELYESVIAERPDLATRFVFMTGGAFTPATQTFLETTPNGRLSKPFDRNELDAALRAVA